MNSSWYLGGAVAAAFVLAIAVSGESEPTLPDASFDYENADRQARAGWLQQYGKFLEHHGNLVAEEGGPNMRLASISTTERAVNLQIVNSHPEPIDDATWNSEEMQSGITKLNNDFATDACVKRNLDHIFIEDTKIMVSMKINDRESKPVEISSATCAVLRAEAKKQPFIMKKALEINK